MKRVLAVFAILTIPLFLLATVQQTARFQTLRAEARRLESLQKDWIEQNRKLLADHFRTVCPVAGGRGGPQQHGSYSGPARRHPAD